MIESQLTIYCSPLLFKYFCNCLDCRLAGVIKYLFNSFISTLGGRLWIISLVLVSDFQIFKSKLLTWGTNFSTKMKACRMVSLLISVRGISNSFPSSLKYKARIAIHKQIGTSSPFKQILSNDDCDHGCYLEMNEIK